MSTSSPAEPDLRYPIGRLDRKMALTTDERQAALTEQNPTIKPYDDYQRGRHHTARGHGTRIKASSGPR